RRGGAAARRRGGAVEVATMTSPGMGPLTKVVAAGRAAGRLGRRSESLRPREAAVHSAGR
ncbi:hypothetical protein ACWD0J_11510, partial [Streptomyces sp. NPDC003011]